MKKKDNEFFGDVLPVKDSEISPEKLISHVEMMKACLGAFLEHSKLRAEINRSIYDAMIEKDFSTEQAFEYVLRKGV